MTEAQSKRLNIADRVIWEGNRDNEGSVVAADPRSVRIRWDNGSLGEIDHRDMDLVESG